jgi:hypothetical protein
MKKYNMNLDILIEINNLDNEEYFDESISS